MNVLNMPLCFIVRGKGDTIPVSVMGDNKKNDYFASKIGCFPE